MTALNGVASGTCTQFAYMMNSGNTEAQDAFADYLLQKMFWKILWRGKITFTL